MVDFFPILHSWKQFQFLGVLKKDKGVRERKEEMGTQILLSLWYVIVYRTSPKKEILRFQSATKAFLVVY